MKKDEFLENLKNWDGKYESLIPELDLPDPANEEEFSLAALRRVYSSNFYRECVKPIYEAQYEKWLAEKCPCSFYDYRDMWRYKHFADYFLPIGEKLTDYSIRRAKMWVSVANVYDIFKENPKVAKLWAKHMDEAEKEIAYQGARAVYDSGDRSPSGMATGVCKALREAEPFQPNDAVYNLNFYVEEKWGSIMPKDNEESKEPETMAM